MCVSNLNLIYHGTHWFSQKRSGYCSRWWNYCYWKIRYRPMCHLLRGSSCWKIFSTLRTRVLLLLLGSMVRNEARVSYLQADIQRVSSRYWLEIGVRRGERWREEATAQNLGIHSGNLRNLNDSRTASPASPCSESSSPFCDTQFTQRSSTALCWALMDWWSFAILISSSWMRWIWRKSGENCLLWRMWLLFVWWLLSVSLSLLMFEKLLLCEKELSAYKMYCILKI